VRSGAPSSLSIELADGSVLEASTAAASGEPVRVRPIALIAPRYFDTCPICGSPATDEEHIPPASMGGRVMTRTCGSCNNRLGSRVEADLTDWHDDALTFPRFSGEVVPGARRSSRLLHRATPEGQFFLVVDQGIDPAVRDLLRSGHVELAVHSPDANRVRLGLLKHAFLAGCLRYGSLEGAEADAVRRDLIAARDAPSRSEVPRSDLALGLTVLRFNEGPRLGWPAIHCIAEMEDKSLEGVLLAGTTFVSWSSDQPPADRKVQQPLHVSLTVGDPVDGIIRAVDGR
jgi:HNH endonuclease